MLGLDLEAWVGDVVRRVVWCRIPFIYFGFLYISGSCGRSGLREYIVAEEILLIGSRVGET